MKLNDNYHITKDNTVKRNPAKSKDPLEPFRAPVWSEQTVGLALRRINAGTLKVSQIFDNNKLLYDGEGVGLTPEQSKKGFDWLINQWKTPTGAERLNNPFGYREMEILSKPREIRLKDFYSERGTYYVPLYIAIDQDGNSMEYYVSGGKISIVG